MGEGGLAFRKSKVDTEKQQEQPAKQPLPSFQVVKTPQEDKSPIVAGGFSENKCLKKIEEMGLAASLGEVGMEIVVLHLGEIKHLIGNERDLEKAIGIFARLYHRENEELGGENTLLRIPIGLGYLDRMESIEEAGRALDVMLEMGKCSMRLIKEKFRLNDKGIRQRQDNGLKTIYAQSNLIAINRTLFRIVNAVWKSGTWKEDPKNMIGSANEIMGAFLASLGKINVKTEMNQFLAMLNDKEDAFLPMMHTLKRYVSEYGVGVLRGFFGRKDIGGENTGAVCSLLASYSDKIGSAKDFEKYTDAFFSIAENTGRAASLDTMAYLKEVIDIVGIEYFAALSEKRPKEFDGIANLLTLVAGGMESRQELDNAVGIFSRMLDGMDAQKRRLVTKSASIVMQGREAGFERMGAFVKELSDAYDWMCRKNMPMMAQKFQGREELEGAIGDARIAVFLSGLPKIGESIREGEVRASVERLATICDNVAGKEDVNAIFGIMKNIYDAKPFLARKGLGVDFVVGLSRVAGRDTGIVLDAFSKNNGLEGKGTEDLINAASALKPLLDAEGMEEGRAGNRKGMVLRKFMENAQAFEGIGYGAAVEIASRFGENSALALGLVGDIARANGSAGKSVIEEYANALLKYHQGREDGIFVYRGCKIALGMSSNTEEFGQVLEEVHSAWVAAEKDNALLAALQSLSGIDFKSEGFAKISGMLAKGLEIGKDAEKKSDKAVYVSMLLRAVGREIRSAGQLENELARMESAVEGIGQKSRLPLVSAIKYFEGQLNLGNYAQFCTAVGAIEGSGREMMRLGVMVGTYLKENELDRFMAIAKTFPEGTGFAIEQAVDADFEAVAQVTGQQAARQIVIESGANGAFMVRMLAGMVEDGIVSDSKSLIAHAAATARIAESAEARQKGSSGLLFEYGSIGVRELARNGEDIETLFEKLAQEMPSFGAKEFLIDFSLCAVQGKIKGADEISAERVGALAKQIAFDHNAWKEVGADPYTNLRRMQELKDAAGQEGLDVLCSKGLSSFGRYSLNVLLSSINRDESLPNFVVIAARADSNGAFMLDQKALENVAGRYNIQLWECATEGEVKTALMQTTNAIAIMFSMHGSPKSGLLSGDGSDERTMLDVTDSEFSQYGGAYGNYPVKYLLFDSCTTGGAAFLSNNLASEFARFLGAEGYAPLTPTSGIKIDVDQNDLLRLKVRFAEQEALVF